MGKGESSGSSRGETVVIDRGEGWGRCGYCKAPGYPSVSHGLLARSMTVDDYQELLDRGWRRSGSFLYRPEMKRTCCPSYTIRLKADEFKPSKEQLRVLKKIQRFWDGIQLNNTNCLTGLSSQEHQSSSKLVVTETEIQRNEKLHEEDKCIGYLSARIEEAVSACRQIGELPLTVQLPKAIVKKVKSSVKKRPVNKSQDLLYTSSISFQIVAVLRQSQTAIFSNAIQSEVCLELTANIVAEKLACCVDRLGALPNMFIKACNGHLNFYSSISQIGTRQFPAAGDVSQRSSKDVGDVAKHGPRPNGNSTMPLKQRRLEIRMNRSSFDPEEYALYRRYQIKVHGDKPEDVTEKSFTRFLVDTPLKFCPPCSGREVPSCGFGSFHQQYIIDGKLVAVGVVDILPKCLSSKYLFWDPDFAFLSLGKFSALKEIEWVKDIQAQCHSLQYYYLGYYIHSCSKMRYKAAYHPSELLCPLRYRWVPFCIARPLLDKTPYVVLSDFMTTQNGASSPGEPLNSYSEAGDNAQEVISRYSFTNKDKGKDFDVEGESELDDENLSLVRELFDDDINNIVIDLNGSRVKFKDLQQVVGPINKETLEMLQLQLHRYARAVGADLADHMIYVPFRSADISPLCFSCRTCSKLLDLLIKRLWRCCSYNSIDMPGLLLFRSADISPLCFSCRTCSKLLDLLIKRL